MTAQSTAISPPDALFIGCSGWQYRHWRGNFYPAELPVRQWLNHYTTVFNTVEINNSFYRLPEPTTFDRWCALAPPRFAFAVKASRFLTHMKKLKEPEEPLQRLFDRAVHLGAKLGPILYQLPPRWPLDLGRLKHFVEALPRQRDHVIELRDPTWYDDRVLELLERHRVGLCLHDMAGSATGRLVVGPFTYVRFHGPARYNGRYSDEVLESWAGFLVDRLRERRRVFAYFNNDVGGHAPRDAVRLRTAIARRL